MPQHQVLERIEERLGDAPHALVLGKQQRQLLLEHQHARRHDGGEIPAVARLSVELVDVGLFELLDRLQVAELELRHAAAALAADERNADVVVLEHGHEVLDEAGVIAIAVARREHGDAALRAAGRLRLGGAADAVLEPRACAARVILRNRCFGVDAERLLEQLAAELRRVDGVDGLRDDGDPGERADRVRRAQDLVAQRRLAVLERLDLRAQHQVREVDVPLVRRHVRALRHVAHVAQITVLDDLPVRLLRHVVHLAARRRVDGIEQRRKRVAEVEAAAAAVADVEDARELLVERGGLGELRRAPIDRVARRRLEAAFAARCWRVAHWRCSRARALPGPRGPGRACER